MAIHRLTILSVLLVSFLAFSSETPPAKPGPDEAFEILKAGNERFVAGRGEHPHADSARLKLAGSANQSDYAYATVLTCSDSRIPVEQIFDAGVMDLFVIRVAGNVCNTDEIGSIEYGLAHVKTPVLIILGHSQCGAVTAVTQQLQGKGHALERNIPPLVKSIEPAVQRALRDNPGLEGQMLIARGIAENVWSGIENLFLASPAVRELAAQDKVKIVGGVYDVGTGRIAWLPENKVQRLLGRVEVDPGRAQDALAAENSGESHSAPHEATPATEPHKLPTVPAHAEQHANQKSAEAAPPVIPAPKKSAHGSGEEHAAAKPSAPDDAHGSSESRHAAASADKKSDPHAAKPAEKAASAHGEPQAKGESSKHAAADEAKETPAVVPAPTGDGRPWTLITAAGVVFVLGIGVALFAFLSGKKSACAAAPPTPQTPAAAH